MCGTSLGLKDACFDKIILTWTASCIHDQKLLFSEIDRVLKPGGHVLILDFFPNLVNGPFNIIDLCRRTVCWFTDNYFVYRNIEEDTMHTGLKVIIKKELEYMSEDNKKLVLYLLKKS